MTSENAGPQQSTSLMCTDTDGHEALLKYNAEQHFSKLSARCCANPPCPTTELKDLAFSFAKMTEQEKVNEVRFMLFSL